MRIKKISDFRRENFEDGRAPKAETIQGWRGAFKEAGLWYIDLDARDVALNAREKKQAALAEAQADPKVAAILRRLQS